MATETLRDFCGSHGRYTFYRTLLYDDVANNRRQIKIGDFVRIRFEQDASGNGAPIPKSRQLYTAEVQLFWTETRNPYRLASVRIYYPPSYLPAEENDSSLFGRDELLSLPEKVVLKVEDLIRCIKAAPQADDFVIMSYNEYCRHQACLRMCAEKFVFSCTSWRRNSCNCILNSRLADKRIYFCRREHDFDQLDELKIRCDELAPSLRGRKRYRQERPNGYKKYLLTVSSSPAQLGGWQVNSKANRADGGPEQKRLRRTARLRCTERSTPISRVEQPKHISPYQTRQRERVSSQATAKKRHMPNLARRSFRRMATTTATKKRASPTAEQNHKQMNDVDTSEPQNGVKRKRGRPRKHPLPVVPSALEVDIKAPCTKTVDDDERPPSVSADHFSSSMEQSPAATASSSATSSGEERKRPRKCVDKTQHSSESCLQILPEYSDEKKQFLRSLIAFMDSIGEPLRKEPSLYYTAVDVYDLYKICIGYGGFDNVCKKRLWRSVYRQLGGTSKNAAVSSYLKRIYQRDLLRFEAHERRDGALRADSVATSLDAESTNSNSNSDEPAHPGSLRKPSRHGTLPFRHNANLPDELANGFAALEDRPAVHDVESNGVNGVEPTCKGNLDKLRKSGQPSPIVRSASRTPQVSRSASRSSSDVRNPQTKLHAETPIATVKHEPLNMPICANGNGNGSINGVGNGNVKSERCNAINAQQLAAPAHAMSALHTANHTAPSAASPATTKPPQEFCRPTAQPASVNLPLFSGMHLPGLSLSSLSNFPLPSTMDNSVTQQPAHCVAPQWFLSPPPNGAGVMSNNHSAPLHLTAPNFNVTSLLDPVNLHPAFPVFCSPGAYQIPLPLLGLLPTADSFNGTLSLPALQNMAMPSAVQLTAAHGNGIMNQLGIAPPLILSNGVNASNPTVHIDPVVEYLKLLIMNAHAGFNNGALPQPHALSQQPLRLDQAVLNPRAASSQLLLPRSSGSAHARAHMTEFEST